MKQENNSHNIYLEVAVEEGLIGLFITSNDAESAIQDDFGLSKAASVHFPYHAGVM